MSNLPRELMDHIVDLPHGGQTPLELRNCCLFSKLWSRVPEDEAGGWIASFSNVEYLELGGQDVRARGWEVAFVLFHGFSPVIKTICMKMSPLPFQRFFDLVLSFPFLEDLAMFDSHDALIDNDGDSDGFSMSTAIQPSCLPVFIGTLDLHLEGGPVGTIIHWPLSPPCSTFAATCVVRPHGLFISVSRRAEAGFVHPLKSNEAQGCVFFGSDRGELNGPP